MGEGSAFCTSQRLSPVITPQRTAVGADSHHHHFLEQCWRSQPATQLTEESITDNCNHVDRTSLDFDMTSYFFKIQKAKKQHLLKYCAATESVQHQQTSRNEAFPYCFVHFIPNLYFYFY